MLKTIANSFVDTTGHIKEDLDHGGVRFEAFWFIPNVMTTSNCFFVTLLVFLRMIAIEKPLQYERMHKRFRRTAVITIWVSAFVLCVLPVISAPFSKGFNIFARFLTLHFCHTFPICMIIIIDIRVVYMLCRSVDNISNGQDASELPQIQDARRNLQDKKNQLSRMLAGVVTCLIICYAPYLIWWHLDISVARRTEEISTDWVRKLTQIKLLIL